MRSQIYAFKNAVWDETFYIFLEQGPRKSPIQFAQILTACG